MILPMLRPHLVGSLSALLLLVAHTLPSAAQPEFNLTHLQSAEIDTDGDGIRENVFADPPGASVDINFAPGVDYTNSNMIIADNGVVYSLDFTVDAVDPDLGNATTRFVDFAQTMDVEFNATFLPPGDFANFNFDATPFYPVNIGSTVGGFEDSSVPIRISGTLDGTMTYSGPDISGFFTSVTYVGTVDDTFSFGSASGFFDSAGRSAGTPELVAAATFASSTNGGSTTATWTITDAPIEIDFDAPVGLGELFANPLIEFRQFLDVGVENFNPAAGERIANGNILLDIGGATLTVNSIISPSPDVNVSLAVAVPVLMGDYNFDGTVNASDYNVWRDSFGSTTELDADGNGDGTINPADYNVWRDNFGRTLGATAASIPEPSTSMLLVLTASLAFARRRCCFLESPDLTRRFVLHCPCRLTPRCPYQAKVRRWN